MAHSPTMRPHPLEPAKSSASIPLANRGLIAPSDSSVAKMNSSLAAQGIESTELALDLILHDIAERARQATSASGAAIAIHQDDAMVCRAAAGAIVPDLGAKITTEHGLSGAFVRTGETQWCADTNADERVDPDACRQLGVRSLAVVPVFAGTSLVGVFEVFSAKPQAFCEQDLHTLQDLAQWVTEAVQGASGTAAARQQGLAVVGSGSPIVTLSQLASRTGASGVLARSSGRVFDPRNRLLRIGIVVAALLLCSLLAFRWGWQKAHSDRSTAASLSSTAPIQSSAVTPQPSPTLHDSSGAADTLAKRESSPKPQAGKLRGGLTVYEKGSVIYQQIPRPAPDPNTRAGQLPATANSEQAVVGKPEQTVSSSPPSSVTQSRSASQPISNSSAQSGQSSVAAEGPGSQIALATPPLNPEAASPSSTAPVRISQGIKEGRVVHRVDPRYPPAALLQHIEGAVVLRAKIGKDGKVHDLKAVSGQSYLTQAAMEAVRQWRYEPYTLNGETVDMHTSITVNFKLPR